MTSKKIVILGLEELGSVSLTCKCGTKVTLQHDAARPVSCSSCGSAFPGSVEKGLVALAELHTLANKAREAGFRFSFEVEDEE